MKKVYTQYHAIIYMYMYTYMYTVDTHIIKDMHNLYIHTYII